MDDVCEVFIAFHATRWINLLEHTNVVFQLLVEPLLKQFCRRFVLQQLTSVQRSIEQLAQQFVLLWG